MIVTVIMYFTTICLMLEYWVHLSHFSTLTHDIDVDSTLIWLFQLWCTFAHRQTLIFSLSSGPSAVLAICDLVTRLHRDEGFYSLICKFSLVSPLCDGEARCEPFNVRAWLIVFLGGCQTLVMLNRSKLSRWLRAAMIQTKTQSKQEQTIH